MLKPFFKRKKIKFKSNNKEIKFNSYLVPFWYEGIGLMFKTKKNAKPLLFSYKFPSRMGIFSYFITFDFLAVWIDNNDEVVDLKIVHPKTRLVKPEKKFTKLIEIPILKKYSKIIKFFNDNNNKIKMIFPSEILN